MVISRVLFFLFFFLALAHSVFVSQVSLAQQLSQGPARIQPPDALSDDVPSAGDPNSDTEPIPPNDSSTTNTSSANSGSANNSNPTLTPPKTVTPTVEDIADDDIVEADAEPVPIIKKNKVRVDRQARPESRFIEHPNAEKGLIKIDKNKVYHYKVPTSEQKGAGSFKIAVYEPTNLENPDDPSRINYDSVYDDTNTPLLLYEHEWQKGRRFGKFGITASGGFFFAKGTGQFADPSIPDEAREEFMMFVIPLHVGVIYRLAYTDTQLFAPYAGGGVGGMAFAERRDDDQNPRLGAALGFSPNAVAYAGLAVQLGKGARSFLDLDREYGINKLWLTAEYRTYIHFGGDYDFSGDAINGGFTAEF